MARAFSLDDRIPVSLLTGFLGSGKTTVLNRLLKHSDLQRTAVIINEFGEVGIDHDLVETVTENLVLLQNGCLCCTVRGDLIDTLRDLYEKSAAGVVDAFDRVIIETTGLADPVPILASLLADPTLSMQFRLDGIITTVDAATAADTLDRQLESVKQIAVADRILLTKTDLSRPAAARELEQRIAAINPGAKIMRAHNGVVDPAMLFDTGIYDPDCKSAEVREWLNAEAYLDADLVDEASRFPGQSRHNRSRHDEHISSVSLLIDEPISMQVFDTWLDSLMAIMGPDMLRMKGLVHVEGMEGPFVLHAVQHVFHPPVPLNRWPSDDQRTRIVLIGRDMNPTLIDNSLKFLRSTAQKKKPKTLPRVGAF